MKLDALFDDYAAFHQTPGNQFTHKIGIPLIVLASLGLLALIPIAPEGGQGNAFLRLDLGLLIWVAASLWYLFLDWKLSSPFVILLLGFYFMGRAIPSSFLWAAFILGWVFQYIGHLKYEKKSPAFYKNFQHLLLGPLWIYSKMVGYKR